MIIVTTDDVAGYRVEQVIGEVTGTGSVLVWTGLGGIDSPATCTQLIFSGRNEAMDRLWISAQELGANAIVGMQSEISTVGQQYVVICVYGTAVVIRPLAEGEPGATQQSTAQAAQTHGQPAAPRQPPPAGRGAPSWLPQPSGAPGPPPGHQAPPTSSVPPSTTPPQPPGDWMQPPNPDRR